MASDLSELDEATLKEMLENASDYESRSKIRAAIRDLKKKSGQPLGRRATGSSQYRRPGFQAPRTVTIPNSVTGNVYPTVVKDGVAPKGIDKTTPTIGYLNAQTVKGRKSSVESSPSHRGSSSSYTANPAISQSGPDDSRWRRSQSSSQSTPPPSTGETPEPAKGYGERRPSANDAIPENSDPFEVTKTPSPQPLKEPTPSPEPLKEPTPSPEPPKEPTPSPEPPKEPTPSPEPPKEPTPSPEPPKELTPSPEPPKELTPSPEPPKEPTPSPEPPKEPTPSPEPLELEIERSPSPEYERQRTPHSDKQSDGGFDEVQYEYEDDEDEELRRLEERDPELSDRKDEQIAGQDAFASVEPGMEEEKDFRKKLKRTQESKIDTKAAFPSRKKEAEQVDFRNLLRKSDGPGKKDFKTGSKAQVDFRTNLKAKQSEESTDSVQPAKETAPKEPEPDSYEARREARRREREERRQKEEAERQERREKAASEPKENGAYDEDSYEARREARRKAREERMKASAQEESEPRMSYRERKEKEEAQRRQEMKANKQKWSEMDQANGDSSKRTYSKQKSSSQSGPQQLLAWCQHKTRYYENVDVKDFSASWKDGLALCAILHNFVPDAIPYDDLSPDNAKENYTIALQAAEDAGLERFFDVEDIIAAGSPDPKSMMTFLVTIYTHFK